MPRGRRRNAGVPPQRLGEEEPEIEENAPGNVESSEDESVGERQAEDAEEEPSSGEDLNEIRNFIRRQVRDALQEVLPEIRNQLGSQSEPTMRAQQPGRGQLLSTDDMQRTGLPPRPIGVSPPTGPSTDSTAASTPAPVAAPTPAAAGGRNDLRKRRRMTVWQANVETCCRAETHHRHHKSPQHFQLSHSHLPSHESHIRFRYCSGRSR